MKKENKKKGFTLAELLIVVAIIAVLAAIAIPVFNNQLTKAKDAAAISNLRSGYAKVVNDYMLNENSGSFTLSMLYNEGKLMNDGGQYYLEAVTSNDVVLRRGYNGNSAIYSIHLDGVTLEGYSWPQVYMSGKAGNNYGYGYSGNFGGGYSYDYSGMNSYDYSMSVSSMSMSWSRVYAAQW